MYIVASCPRSHWEHGKLEADILEMGNIENWEAQLVEDTQGWRMNVEKNEKVGNSSDTTSPLARLNIEQPILGGCQSFKTRGPKVKVF